MQKLFMVGSSLFLGFCNPVAIASDQEKYAQCLFSTEIVIGNLSSSKDDLIAAYRRRADAEMHLGQYSPAIGDLRKALGLCLKKPQMQADIYETLAEAHYAQDDLPAAIAACETALQTNKHGSLYFLKAKIEDKQDFYMAAVTDCDNALRVGGCAKDDVRILKERVKQKQSVIQYYIRSADPQRNNGIAFAPRPNPVLEQVFQQKKRVSSQK